MIEWVISAARQSGLDDFCVVVGYRGAQVEAFLKQLARKMDIRITAIFNREWERGNGTSVLEARQVVEGDFILSMADHIFDPATLKDLQREPIDNGEVILAVDRQLESNGRINIDDVTKVQIDGGRIEDIGKQISRYNAYDTGLFLCSQALFNALEKRCKDGRSCALSEAVSDLGRRGKVRSFDIGDRFWMDVDDDGDFLKAEELLTSAYRDLGARITGCALHLPDGGK